MAPTQGQIDEQRTKASSLLSQTLAVLERLFPKVVATDRGATADNPVDSHQFRQLVRQLHIQINKLDTANFEADLTRLHEEAQKHLDTAKEKDAEVLQMHKKLDMTLEHLESVRAQASADADEVKTLRRDLGIAELRQQIAVSNVKESLNIEISSLKERIKQLEAAAVLEEQKCQIAMDARFEDGKTAAKEELQLQRQQFESEQASTKFSADQYLERRRQELEENAQKNLDDRRREITKKYASKFDTILTAFDAAATNNSTQLATATETMQTALQNLPGITQADYNDLVQKMSKLDGLATGDQVEKLSESLAKSTDIRSTQTDMSTTLTNPQAPPAKTANPTAAQDGLTGLAESTWKDTALMQISDELDRFTLSESAKDATEAAASAKAAQDFNKKVLGLATAAGLRDALADVVKSSDIKDLAKTADLAQLSTLSSLAEDVKKLSVSIKGVQQALAPLAKSVDVKDAVKDMAKPADVATIIADKTSSLATAQALTQLESKIEKLPTLQKLDKLATTDALEKMTNEVQRLPKTAVSTAAMTAAVGGLLQDYATKESLDNLVAAIDALATKE